jgi:nucleotide-binding universal stress UspA family protein
MKILIAADKETGESLIDRLRDRSWSPDDEFRVATVLDVSDAYTLCAEDGGSPHVKERALGEQRQDLVDKLSGKIKARYPLSKITTSVLAGDATEALTAEADQWLADLMVIGTHHRHGLSRWLEGSVSEKVTKAAGCSMLIVPINVLTAR